MKIQKNSVIIATVIIVLSGCVGYNEESPIKESGHNNTDIPSNGRIGVLIESKWNLSDGFPQTDYLGMLRETISALDFLGYKYDILDETVTGEELYSYESLITIVGNDYTKITNFSEKTGKVVTILYAPSEKLLSRLNDKGKGWTDKIDINITSNVCINSKLTDRVFDNYGIFSIFKIYNIQFDPKARILCKTEDGTPLLVEQFYNRGHYIFIPIRDITWKQYNYNLIDNIIKNNTPLLRIGSVPYAQDVAVIVRLDDFSGHHNSWSRYLNITKDLSIASIMNKTSSIELSYVDGDILPHGYDHEDLSTLDYSEESTILSMSKDRFFEFTGKSPKGYVSPYNRISENTTTIGNNLGLNFFTTYIGMAQVPRHYYLKDKNNVWILGSRNENFSNESAIMDVLSEYNSRGGVVMFLDHPYTKYNTGSIDSSLRTLTSVTQFINNHEGYYLTTLNDFFQTLTDAKYVKIKDSKLVVDKDVDSGITFYYKKCTDQIKIDNFVMIYCRNGSTILPYMKKGEYNIELTKGYPTIGTRGGFIKSAIFNTITKEMIVILHSSTNMTIKLYIEQLDISSRYRVKDYNKEYNILTDKNGLANTDINLIGGTNKEITISKI